MKQTTTGLIKILLALMIGFSIMVCESPTSSNTDGRGACSGHGGVNCSAGPDNDGSVICVDGWEGSRVQYSSVAKCH